MHDNTVDTLYDEIVGDSKEIKGILYIAERIATSDAAVMIYGESGTGKELVARFIQNNSRRKEKKFVAINCAAIPGELLENELFGHKKGAFTDAKEDYTGKFGYANGGTIFLDEIGEMSLALQSKLLRVLAMKEYEPVGSTEVFKADVRIIAATNKNLLELIKENKFREDLYYRLNVVPITIPPLRDRSGDIEVLANYFLKIYNKKNNKSIKGFTPGSIDMLNSYKWPGNVRELQNVIERAVILCNIDFITVEFISISDKAGLLKSNNKIKNLKDALNDFKKNYIIQILEKNNWNQTKTAKDLDIQRTYLSRLIKDLHINKL